jgi:hypothetical protein
MAEKFKFVRLPLLLLFLFFIGKLIVGAAGGTYELSNRLFAMVPMTVHLCLIWGAVGKAYHGHRVTDTLLTSLMIALFAQILIFSGTMGSYLVGAQTAFNNPVAMIGQAGDVSFSEALGARTTGLIVNSIIGMVSGTIGWALGGLLPQSQR